MFMTSNKLQALEKQTELPKTGGRGVYHRDQPRDKNVRLRTELYKKIVKLGTAENDVDDLVSMLYDFWEKHHKEK
jgi:hypothetical protein